ncbi:MAG: CHRD domain-containing protein [Pirellulaceae bacterium]
MRYILTLFAVMSMFACTTASAAIINFTATLDGLQEVPPNASTGTGFAAITFNDATSELAWDISWSGLTGGNASAMHFHNAPVGVNGGIVIDIGAISGLTSPSIGSTVISPFLASELFLQRLYINIHNDDFGGGEIRGQVIPEPASASLVAGLAGVLLWRRRHS